MCLQKASVPPQPLVCCGYKMVISGLYPPGVICHCFLVVPQLYGTILYSTLESLYWRSPPAPEEIIQ